jgi:hypothetical protein
MKLMKFKILNFFLHLYFGWSVCKPEYTSHEVYSLWGRVEKMLFRPIGKKQNSLSFNKVCQWLATGRWFPPQYSWNIVESGVYHHQTNPCPIFTMIHLNNLMICNRNSFSFVPIWSNAIIPSLFYFADGGLLLGASSLTGQYWLGSLWYYQDPSQAPDVEKCTAGVQLEAGIIDAKWLDSNKVIVGLDTGKS